MGHGKCSTLDSWFAQQQSLRITDLLPNTFGFYPHSLCFFKNVRENMNGARNLQKHQIIFQKPLNGLERNLLNKNEPLVKLFK